MLIIVQERKTSTREETNTPHIESSHGHCCPLYNRTPPKAICTPVRCLPGPCRNRLVGALTHKRIRQSNKYLRSLLPAPTQCLLLYHPSTQEAHNPQVAWELRTHPTQLRNHRTSFARRPRCPLPRLTSSPTGHEPSSLPRLVAPTTTFACLSDTPTSSIR